MKTDWKEVVAGQRVVTIKPYESKGWFKHGEGELEFGTELVVAEGKEIIPSYGESLIKDAALTRQVRADTAAVLHLDNV